MIKDWIAAFERPELGEATVNSESFKSNSWTHMWKRLCSCIFSRYWRQESISLYHALEFLTLPQYCFTYSFKSPHELWMWGTLLSFKVEEIFYQKVNNMHKTRISYTKKPGFKLGPRDYWATVSYSTPCLARAHCSSCLHLVHTWCT